MQRCNFTFRETATGDARARSRSKQHRYRKHQFTAFLLQVVRFICTVSLRFVVLTSISIVMRVQHIYVYNTWQQTIHAHPCRKLMTMTPKHRLILPQCYRVHTAKAHRKSHRSFFCSDKSHEILPFVRCTNKQKTLQTSPQMKTFNINFIRSSLKWFIVI